MHTVNAKEARKSLSTLLDEAENGGEVSITRRGREVARLVPSSATVKTEFPDMTHFRKSIQPTGQATSQQVVAQREEERY